MAKKKTKGDRSFVGDTSFNFGFNVKSSSKPSKPAGGGSARTSRKKK